MSSYAGKRFEIVIPSVEERIVHRALRECVERVVEPDLLVDFVHGYRPCRNRVTAVRQAAALLLHANTVVDVDVAGASAGGTVDAAVASVARFISDGSFLLTLRHALQALPLPLAPGSGLSPLLLNLRLAPVDEKIADIAAVRFADNYCLFLNNVAHASAARARLVDALGEQGLAPSIEKSRLRHAPNPEDLFLLLG